MNMAAAYNSLTIPQLKQMLGAAHADHRRQMEETRAKWAAEVAALREAMSKHLATLTAELQSQKNANAALRRELDIVHEELAKANAVIVEQGRKLTAHSEVADLEKRLQLARRMAS
jgi:predicted TIM-barrel enzyme